MNSPPILGLDLGGTVVKGLVCDDEGRILVRDEQPTGDDGTPAWRDNVAALVRRLTAARPGVRDLGIACPGLAARDENAIFCMPGRLPGLEGLVWRSFLGWDGALRVLNDAHAALLGEVWCGAARGATHALLLTLGTGVGGAVLGDGRLLRGHLGRAGHLGHVSLDPAGRPDVTGTPGSLEDAIGECTLAARSGGRFTRTRDLLAAAAAGDAEAARVWRTSVRALAAGLAGLINAFDPEVVVLGGGVAAAGPALFDPLRADLDRFEWRPGGHRVRLVPAALGSDAGALGAAWRARGGGGAAAARP